MRVSAEAAFFVSPSAMVCSGLSIPMAAVFFPRASIRFASIRTTSEIPIAYLTLKPVGRNMAACTSGALQQRTGWRVGNSIRSAAGPMNSSPVQDRSCWRLHQPPSSAPLSGYTGATRSFQMSLIPDFRRTSAKARTIIAQDDATNLDCSAPLSTTSCTGRPTGEGLTSF